MVCPSTPALFHAVGQFYVDFRQTTDAEVIQTLDRARRRIASHSEAA